jgi:hypothetical protein
MSLFSTGLGFNNGAQSQKQFVAVARTTGVNENQTNVVMTSLDGVNWKTQNITNGYFQGTYLEDVAWSPSLNLWVAVQSTDLPSGSLNMIWTSPNGITWTSRNLPASLSGIYALSPNAVIWIPEQNTFLATGKNGNNSNGQGAFFVTSTDGITWNNSGLSTSSNFNFRSLAYSPSLGRAVASKADGTAGVYYSNNLTTWTSSGGDPTVGGYQSVIWVEELSLFVTVSDLANSGPKAAYSSDGLTWIQSTPADTGGFQGLAWSPKLGIMVAVSVGGTHRVMWSTDGINWSTSGVSGASSYNWNSVCWSEDLEMFVAVGGTATMSSKDGLIWTYAPGSLTGTRNLTSVKWGGIYNA